MKKNILMLLVGIFILPNLCESYLSMYGAQNEAYKVWWG